MIEHEELPFPDAPKGKAGVGALFQSMFDAFPGFEMVVEDTIAEGDKVVTRVLARGTHQGEFMGIPATGNKISVKTIAIIRIKNGKVVEHWGVTDGMAMMEQLNAGKAK